MSVIDSRYHHSSDDVSVDVNQRFLAKLLRRPRGRSVIRAQCQEKTGEKEMFSDVDGRRTEKKMLGCRMAMSSRRVMQRPEMFVDRQLLAGMMARAIGVMMLTEVK